MPGPVATQEFWPFGDSSRFRDMHRSLDAVSAPLNIIAELLKFSTVQEKLLEHDAERKLYDACRDAEPRVNKFLSNGDYAGYYQLILGLTPAIEAFFDNVKVDEDGFRKNRLNLIGKAARLLNAAIDTRSLYA